MNFIKALRPDTKKIGWSIIAGIIWYIIGVFFYGIRFSCDCTPGGFTGCTNYPIFHYAANNTCQCSCVGLGTSLYSLFILLLPLIILYLIMSYVKYRNNNK